MKRNSRLVRTSICHNVFADPTDILNNGWHNGWRKPEGGRTAFYYKRNWWSSDTKEGRCVLGPYISKEEALNVTLTNPKEPLKVGDSVRVYNLLQSYKYELSGEYMGTDECGWHVVKDENGISNVCVLGMLEKKVDL